MESLMIQRKNNFTILDKCSMMETKEVDSEVSVVEESIQTIFSECSLVEEEEWEEWEAWEASVEWEVWEVWAVEAAKNTLSDLAEIYELPCCLYNFYVS